MRTTHPDTDLEISDHHLLLPHLHAHNTPRCTHSTHIHIQLTHALTLPGSELLQDSLGANMCEVYNCKAS
jgi:hypothetical protein